MKHLHFSILRITVFLLALNLLIGMGYQGNAQHDDKDHSFLRMIENKGQWDHNITFKAEIPEGYLYATTDGLTYQFFDPVATGEILKLNHDGQLGKIADMRVDGHVLHVNFHGANPRPKIEGGAIYPEKRNYFLGNDASRWASGVSTYEDIWYREIYREIDFHLFQTRRSLKYEFIVHPGGSYHDIGFDIEGANQVRILPDGDLEIVTSINTIVEQAPYAFQKINGELMEVPCRFALKGHKVYYEVTGRIDPRYDLVIDPQLIFATYSGSTADNWGNTACLDNDGNLYTGGTVFEFGSGTAGPAGQFPATSGAFQTTFQGGDTDIGILKFDPEGTFLMYATYIGGNGAEIPLSTIVDERNQELLILGTTGSSNFPMGSTNPYDGSFNGGDPIIPVGGYQFNNGTDIVLIRLNQDGSDVVASTYFGGTENDGIMDFFNEMVNNYGDQLRGDINVDDDGNVYVASMTYSSQTQGFPVSSDAYQGTFGGGETDGCVFKMSPNFETLEWCTYLGGAGDDALFSIQRDENNGVYVAGGTNSTDYPTVNGALNSPLGEEDAVVCHLSTGGDTLIASTRLGTSSFDEAYFVQVDDLGDVYVLGQTTGFYDVTAGTYVNPNSGIFIQQLNSGLDSLLVSTTIGSGNILTTNVVPDISPTAFLVNDCQNILLSGWGGAVNQPTVFYFSAFDSVEVDYNGGNTIGLPVTDNAFQSTTDGSDFYFMVIEKDMKTLLYSTYFGGPSSNEHVDGGTSRFDKTGVIYQSVCAGCGREVEDFLFYVPEKPDNNPNTYPQWNQSLNCNNGVIKFDLASLEADIQNAPECIPLTHTFFNNTLGGIDYTWIFGDGDTLVTETAVDVTHTFPTEGQYTVKLVATDLTTCKKRDTVFVDVNVIDPLEPKAYEDSLCPGDVKQLSVVQEDRDATYQWIPTDDLDDPTSPEPIFTADSIIRYTILITDTLGCEREDTYDIFVPNIVWGFDPQIFGNCKAMEAPTVEFNNTSFTNQVIGETIWSWQIGDEGEVLEYDPVYQFGSYDTFTVVITATFGGCVFDTTIGINLEPVEFPNIITPNGDDKNEQFVITGMEGTGEWMFEVYNRWSKLVYKNEDYDNTWGGLELSDGTYYFLITSPDGNKCKNWVEIIR